MKIMIARTVVTERPDLVDGLSELGSVACLDTFLAFGPTVEAITRFGPDMMLIGKVMADLTFLSSLFSDYLDAAGAGSARVALAVRHPSNVVKIRAAQSGYDDVIDLGFAMPEIVAAVRNVSLGRFALDSDLLWRELPRPVSRRRISLGEVTHDPADEEILNLVAIGLSDLEIASALYLSPQTIRNRISHMLIRSGMINRTQLAWVFHHRDLLKRLSPLIPGPSD